jgi:hypothetical protein
VALGSTQPLTEMSTRDLPWGKGLPVRKVDNPTASVNGLSRKCGSLDVLQPYGPPRSLRGIADLFNFTRHKGFKGETKIINIDYNDDNDDDNINNNPISLLKFLAKATMPVTAKGCSKRQ